MGCCESSPDAVLPETPMTNPSSLAPNERIVYQKIIAKIPVHCRQPILNLPARPFLYSYTCHVLATAHLGRSEIQTALVHEARALTGLEALLPSDPENFIFADVYRNLGIISLMYNQVQEAIKARTNVIVILLKHIPTNYIELSEALFELTVACKLAQDWRSAVAHLKKAIETARLCRTPNQQWIEKLEADLVLCKKRAIDTAMSNLTLRKHEPNPGESQTDFFRRITAEMYAYNANHGTLSIDLAEITRIPDKKTESQVDQEILNKVLTSLENYLNGDALRLFQDGMSGLEFLAASYKLRKKELDPWSPAIIEAALTMIIDRMKVDDGQYLVLKQSPLFLSYNDDSLEYAKGVRTFRVAEKDGINLKNNETSSPL